MATVSFGVVYGQFSTNWEPMKSEIHRLLAAASLGLDAAAGMLAPLTETWPRWCPPKNRAA